MFNNNHCVAKITESKQRLNQTPVVTLMQTNTRLIQHIQGSYKSRTNLTRKTDSLSFTARKCSGRARQCEVIKTHVEEESKSSIDFFGDSFGNHGVTIAQRQAREEGRRFSNRHVADS